MLFEVVGGFVMILFFLVWYWLFIGGLMIGMVVGGFLVLIGCIVGVFGLFVNIFGLL